MCAVTSLRKLLAAVYLVRAAVFLEKGCRGSCDAWFCPSRASYWSYHRFLTLIPGLNLHSLILTTEKYNLFLTKIQWNIKNSSLKDLSNKF